MSLNLYLLGLNVSSRLSALCFRRICTCIIFTVQSHKNAIICAKITKKCPPRRRMWSCLSLTCSDYCFTAGFNHIFSTIHFSVPTATFMIFWTFLWTFRAYRIRLSLFVSSIRRFSMNEDARCFACQRKASFLPRDAMLVRYVLVAWCQFVCSHSVGSK